jgi:hypothetical protein
LLCWIPQVQYQNRLPDSRLFLKELFPSAGAATLQTPQAAKWPSLQRAKGRNRSASAEPTRRSLRQAAIKTSVPVSQRATTRLIRELELAGPGEPISEGVRKQYTDLFQGPWQNLLLRCEWQPAWVMRRCPRLCRFSPWMSWLLRWR